MAKIKKENLKDTTNEELRKQLLEVEENIRSLRFKAQGSKSKNVKESSTLRKRVARILTEINNRQTKNK